MRFPSVIALLACLGGGAAFAEPARTAYGHYDPALLCATARELRQAGNEEGARILLARAKRLAPWHACAERQPAPSAPGKPPSAPPAVAPEPPRPWPAK